MWMGDFHFSSPIRIFSKTNFVFACYYYFSFYSTTSMQYSNSWLRYIFGLGYESLILWIISSETWPQSKKTEDILNDSHNRGLNDDQTIHYLAPGSYLLNLKNSTKVI